MASILERMRQHRMSLDARYIDIPEWGEGEVPLRIYAKPETLEDSGAIVSANDKGADYAVAETLVRLARNEAGDRLFKSADVTELRKQASGPVALRVANFLREPATVDDALKNSEASAD